MRLFPLINPAALRSHKISRLHKTQSTSTSPSNIQPSQTQDVFFGRGSELKNEEVNPKQLTEALFQRVLQGKNLFLSLDVDGHLFPYQPETVLVRESDMQNLKGLIKNYDKRVALLVNLARLLKKHQGFTSVAFNTARSANQVENLFFDKLQGEPIAIASENGGLISDTEHYAQFNSAHPRAQVKIKNLKKLFDQNQRNFSQELDFEFTGTRLSLFNATPSDIELLEKLATQIDKPNSHLKLKKLEHIAQVAPSNFSKDTGLYHLLDLTQAKDFGDLVVVHSGDGRGEKPAFEYLRHKLSKDYPNAEGVSVFVGSNREDVDSDYVLFNKRDAIKRENRKYIKQISTKNTDKVWQTLERLYNKLSDFYIHQNKQITEMEYA